MITITIKTFKRYELKYFLNEEQFQIIKKALEEHAVLDKYCQKTGTYMIYNLYFDTENDDVITHSVSKPYYKEKLRLRSYKVPVSDNDTVFLELKKKINGIVAKRRATLTYAQAQEFLNTGVIPETDNFKDRQVLCEITDFLERYPSEPKVYISYERIAYFDKNDKDFRVSFDKKILTRRNNVSFKDNDYGTPLIDDGTYLMEIKLSNYIPKWLCSILSEQKIYPQGFSKYGTEFRNYIDIKNRTHKIKSTSHEMPDTIISNGIPLNILSNKGVNQNVR